MVVRFFSRGGNKPGNGDGQAHPQGLERKPSALTQTPARRDTTRTGTLVELPPIPEKIYFRIGEVAHLVGVEPHVLRYWEHEFRSIRPTKS
ncbi:MAG: MerR family transcriptional regulator, partial [Polyangiales bacterium]